MRTIVEEIEYYVRPESDGKYEVIKVTKKVEHGWSSKVLGEDKKSVYIGRLSDCESFINLSELNMMEDE
tara:strand:+ start:1026 stop:1232 length:207 start_codon:yes stop_codon:yes gene_type:complete